VLPGDFCIEEHPHQLFPAVLSRPDSAFGVQVVTANSPDAIAGAFDEAVKGRAEAMAVSTSGFAIVMRASS
jgi:hypothetical protein